MSLVDVRLVVEGDTPETRAVSPVGSAEEVEQATPGTAQPSPPPPPPRRLTYVFACFRSSRPGPLGNRCSYEGRGTSGGSSGGKRACLPTPRSSCRCGVLKWRTSAFAVST